MRIGELLLGVVARLLAQRGRFEQLALDDVVDVDQFVLVGQFAVEQAVYFVDDRVEPGFFLFLHAAAARFGDRRQLRRVAAGQRQRARSLVFQVVVRQHDFGQVDAFAFAAKFQQRQQALVADGALLYSFDPTWC